MTLGPFVLLSVLAFGAAPPGPVPPEPESPQPSALSLAPLRVFGDSAIWFSEEAFPVEDAVAEFLAAEGWSVAPLAPMRDAVARLDAGLFPDREGGCDALPPAAHWLERRHGAAAMARADLRCHARQSPWEQGAFEPGCRLRVLVTEGRGGGEVERWEGTIPLGAGPEEVAAAVRGGALHPAAPPPSSGGLLGGLGASPSEPVRLVERDEVGPWVAADLDGFSSRLIALRTPLAKCASDGPLFDSWGNPTQLAVGVDGVVTRCGRQFPDHHGPPKQACECRVIRENVRFSPASGERRLRFTLSVLPSTPRPAPPRDPLDTSITLEIASSSDPDVWIAIDTAREPIATCAREGVGGIPGQEWPISFRIGPDGRVASADVGIPLDGGSEALRSCLTGALGDARFTCPPTGVAAVEAVLRMSRTPSGSYGLPQGVAAELRTRGISLPDHPWVFEPVLPDTPLLLLPASGPADPHGAGTGREVRVAADARATVASLNALLARDAPRATRVFLVAEADSEAISLRFLRVAPEGAIRVPVHGSGDGAPAPPASSVHPRIGAPPAVFVADPAATVEDLIRAARGAGTVRRILAP